MSLATIRDLIVVATCVVIAAAAYSRLGCDEVYDPGYDHNPALTDVSTPPASGSR